MDEKCDEFPVVQLNKEIRSTLSNMLSKKEISEKVMNYITKKKHQFDEFYLLLQIHKRTFNVPDRPVISNTGTATEKIHLCIS